MLYNEIQTYILLENLLFCEKICIVDLNVSRSSHDHYWQPLLRRHFDEDMDIRGQDQHQEHEDECFPKVLVSNTNLKRQASAILTVLVFYWMAHCWYSRVYVKGHLDLEPVERQEASKTSNEASNWSLLQSIQRAFSSDESKCHWISVWKWFSIPLCDVLNWGSVRD